MLVFHLFVNMRFLIFVLIFIEHVSSYLREPRPDEGAEIEDKYLNALDILRKYGYPAENHTVTTEDGYILTLHRIPYGRLCPRNETKGPLLLQHGLFCSSMEFIVTGTKRALAYVLADSCYDVWIPNSRGNTYSRAHLTLDVRSQAYWNFSWHELAIYDLPASIDYILNVTKYKSLLFAGHSQGGTTYLVLASLLPEYAEKIKVGFLLAPIAIQANTKSGLIKGFAKLENALKWASKNFGINDFLSHNKLMTEVGGAICKKAKPTNPGICENLLMLGCGFDTRQINNTILAIALGHTPAGASVKQVLHYTQGLNKGNFAYFDYGTVKNMEVYNQKEPPSYDLSKVKTHTVIFYSSNDWLAPPEDIDILYDRLTNCKREKILIPNKKFNHVDFLYAKDVLYLFYDLLVETLDKYTIT